MDRASKLDGSIPVPALLYPDETLLADQDGVGLYDGQAKAPDHQLGSVHVTSHRLLYIDAIHPRRNSLEFMLFHIAQTEYYGGFLTSSAKITIIFQPSARTSSSVDQPVPHASNPVAPRSAPELPTTTTTTTAIRWECEICGFKNVSTGLTPSTICQLCGVPRTSALPASASTTTLGSDPVLMSTSSRAVTSGSVSSLSKSLPSSVISTPGRRLSPPPLPSTLSSTSPGTASEEDAQIACPACTFLNYPSLRNCEMCGTVLPKPPPSSSHHSRIDTPLKGRSAPSSRPVSPARESTGGGDILKISFRKGGDKQLYAALKTALEAKVWQAVEPAAPVRKNRTGIHGLVELRRNEVESTATSMQSALQDLEALMKQAKEMVALAESFNRSLKEHEAQREQLPEDAQFIIGSSMARLGLVSTVPSSFEDKGKSEAEWLDDLARELTTVLLGVNGDGGLMKHRGMIALDEVWGAWNRARGVALIPPATFMQVLPILATQTQRRVLTRAFHSNLKVVHTPWYSQKSFTSRLLTYLDATGPRKTGEIARQENLSVGLVQEMIFSAEQDGAVVRDEALHVVGDEMRETTWWRNLFEGYVWDGEEV